MCGIHVLPNGKYAVSAGAPATLHSILRYARVYGWIAIDPVDRLESHERPRGAMRVLGIAVKTT